MQKDILESKRVNRLIRARVGHCYSNAFRVVLIVPEYANAEYVEGMAVNTSTGLVVEHGWIEKDGQIVDPTLPDEPMAYFPGLRFKGREGLAQAMSIPKPAQAKPRDLPIFLRFGWGGIDSLAFRTASIAAYRFAGMDALAEDYENYGLREPGAFVASST